MISDICKLMEAIKLNFNEEDVMLFNSGMDDIKKETHWDQITSKKLHSIKLRIVIYKSKMAIFS